MRPIETSYLYEIASKEGILIERWDFPQPLDAIYLTQPGIPPTIGIANRIPSNSSQFRCILAEELGHHFTTAGKHITQKHMSYNRRLEVSKVEYKAMKWAAETLIPYHNLRRAIIWESHWTNYNIAEYFDVTIEMIEFRMQLNDAQELIEYTRLIKYG